MALTGLGLIDKVIEALSVYVVGSPQGVGTMFFSLLFIFGIMLRLPMLIILLLLLPINIILVAFRYIYVVVTAVHVLLILFVLGFTFLRQKQ